jgi:hypothetical protein
LDYLANRRHTLSDDLRYQLTEVVNGYIGRCDEDAARAGIDWMRERYRADGRAGRHQDCLSARAGRIKPRTWDAQNGRSPL